MFHAWIKIQTNTPMLPVKFRKTLSQLSRKSKFYALFFSSNFSSFLDKLLIF